mmetsp:Transcript_50739/g.149611  ORF Transcript_50739/g.149611 Transcript_50739/m.149611 type:complete len:249 (+) Transcript_50739:365-1111(+)
MKHTVDVLLEERQLVRVSQPVNDAGVRFKHALPEAVQVIHPLLVGRAATILDPRAGRLLQHLDNGLQVLLEVAGDGECDVAEAGHDGSLDLSVDGLVLQVPVEDLQDGVAVGDESALQGSAEVADHAGGHVAHLDVVKVLEANLEVRRKVGHESLKVHADGVGHGGDEQESLLLETRSAALHLLVGRDDLHGLRHDALGDGQNPAPQPLHQRGQNAADEALKLALALDVLERGRQLPDHLLQERLHVR